MLHLKHKNSFYNRISSAESQTRSVMTFLYKKLVTKKNIVGDE